MVLLVELAELAVLMGMSLVLVVRVIFRPTDASLAQTRSATAARQEQTGPIAGRPGSLSPSAINGRLTAQAREGRRIS